MILMPSIWMIIFIPTVLLAKEFPDEKTYQENKEVYLKKIGEEVIAILLLNNYTLVFTK